MLRPASRQTQTAAPQPSPPDPASTASPKPSPHLRTQPPQDRRQRRPATHDDGTPLPALPTNRSPHHEDSPIKPDALAMVGKAPDSITSSGCTKRGCSAVRVLQRDLPLALDAAGRSATIPVAVPVVPVAASRQGSRAEPRHQHQRSEDHCDRLAVLAELAPLPTVGELAGD